MTDEPLSALTLYSTYHAADEVEILDTTDATFAPTGTNKRIQFSALLSMAGVALTGQAVSFSGLTVDSLSGLLKASSGVVSTAVAGTDYLSPSGSGAALTGITAGQIGSAPAGILKGASGAIVAASAGTDYLTPTGSGAGLSGVVLTGGSYANPAWLTSISGGIVSGNIAGNAASITGSITTSQVSNLGSWGGSTSLSTLGTITAGTWQGSAIGASYLTALGAAGAAHSAGIVPDPGSTSHSPPYLLGDDAAWHATIPGSQVSGNISGNAAGITGSITTSQVAALPSGLLKGSAGSIVAATAGTDYLTPTGSGTGLSGVALLGSANGFSAANTFTQGLTSNGALTVSSTSNLQAIFQYASNTSYYYPYACFQRSRGTLSGMASVQAGDYIGAFNFYGWNGSAWCGTVSFGSTVQSMSGGGYPVGSLYMNINDGTGAGANYTALAVTSTGVTVYGPVTAPQAGPLSSKTGAYTATTGDRILFCSAASAGWALTLPAVSSTPAGFELTIKKVDANSNASTVTPSGSDKIDGASSYALSSQYKYIHLICDGVSNWCNVGSN